MKVLASLLIEEIRHAHHYSPAHSEVSQKFTHKVLPSDIEENLLYFITLLKYIHHTWINKRKNKVFTKTRQDSMLIQLYFRKTCVFKTGAGVWRRLSYIRVKKVLRVFKIEICTW